MINYLRILRLPDQYTQIASVLLAALFFTLPQTEVILWLIATTLISFIGFIVNEYTDKEDTDKFTWNKAHFRNWKEVDTKVLFLMSVVFAVVAFIIGAYLGQLRLIVIMLVLALCYSLKPIRLKGVFVLDILTQGVVWFVIPFIGLLKGYPNQNLVSYTTVLLFCYLWSGFFPYQIADYKADKEVKLASTHVILGVNTSIKLCLVLGGLAVVLYVLNPVLYSLKWTWFFAPVLIVILLQEAIWLRVNNLSTKLALMQNYVRLFKPLTRLLVLYLGYLYFYSV